MQSEKQHHYNSYLFRVMKDSINPFHHRKGIHILLGTMDSVNISLNSKILRPPVGFKYANTQGREYPFSSQQGSFKYEDFGDLSDQNRDKSYDFSRSSLNNPLGGRRNPISINHPPTNKNFYTKKNQEIYQDNYQGNSNIREHLEVFDDTREMGKNHDSSNKKDSYKDFNNEKNHIAIQDNAKREMGKNYDSSNKKDSYKDSNNEKNHITIQDNSKKEVVNKRGIDDLNVYNKNTFLQSNPPKDNILSTNKRSSKHSNQKTPNKSSVADKSESMTKNKLQNRNIEIRENKDSIITMQKNVLSSTENQKQRLSKQKLVQVQESDINKNGVPNKEGHTNNTTHAINKDKKCNIPTSDEPKNHNQTNTFSNRTIFQSDINDDKINAITEPSIKRVDKETYIKNRNKIDSTDKGIQKQNIDIPGVSLTKTYFEQLCNKKQENKLQDNPKIPKKSVSKDKPDITSNPKKPKYFEKEQKKVVLHQRELLPNLQDMTKPEEKVVKGISNSTPKDPKHHTDKHQKLNQDNTLQIRKSVMDRLKKITQKEAHTSIDNTRKNSVVHSNTKASETIDNLRQRVHRMASKLSNKQKKDDYKEEDNNFKYIPVPEPQPVTLIKRSMNFSKAPYAFWERSHLSRLQLRPLR